MIKTARNAIAFRIMASTLAAMCVVFGSVHLAWAFGWRWGLPVDAALLAGQRLFVTYEVVVGLLMYVAAGICVAICRVELSSRWHRRVATLMLFGSQLALIRGICGMIFDIYALSTTATVLLAGVLADMWFALAGLSGLVIWLVLDGGRHEVASP